MTYCVGVLLDEGIVCLSDTRTNAGLDNISVYRKMFTFEVPDDRIIVVMTAGSLSVTQTALARIEEATHDIEATPETSILLAPTMLKVADIIGETLAATRRGIADRLSKSSASSSASMIVAGQRRDGEMRMFLIYAEGNYIEATADTPYLQIGEHKYGKPILDRVATPDMPLLDAKKALLLSMDSTIRSNLSVGMPLDLAVIGKDALRITEQRRIGADDPAFQKMSRAWSEALKAAYREIEI